MYAPLRHLLKEADLQNFRLENGLKIWPALWDYRHPNAACFTTPVRPKKNNHSHNKTVLHSQPHVLNSTTSAILGASESPTFHDIFIGSNALAKKGDEIYDQKHSDIYLVVKKKKHLLIISFVIQVIFVR